MLEVNVVLGLLVLHFVADFLMQNDWMATNKSKNMIPLLVHVTVYSLPFGIFLGWQFALITWATHALTDLTSSKATTILWQKEERHWFFVVIGMDQLIHYICLIGTYMVLFT